MCAMFALDHGGAPRCESEPDSNHFERREDDANDANDVGESDTDEDVQVEKESVAEADTTDNNDMRQPEEQSEEVDTGDVVVCQAVADEGLVLVDAVARTSNCGSGGSPDDGGGSNRDLVYNRADCGVAAASSHRNSTDGVGDLVSGSGCVDDESESFRTTNSSLVNGDSEAAVKEDDNLSDKCQLRKRTASQTDDDDAASFQSSVASCRPSGSQDNSQAAVSVSLPKRCRSDSMQSDTVANGNDDIDDDREWEPPAVSLPSLLPLLFLLFFLLPPFFSLFFFLLLEFYKLNTHTHTHTHSFSEPLETSIELKLG